MSMCRRMLSLLYGLGMAIVLPFISAKVLAVSLACIMIDDPLRWPRQQILTGAPCSRICMASGTVRKAASSFFAFIASTMGGKDVNRIALNSVPVVVVLDAKSVTGQVRWQ